MPGVGMFKVSFIPYSLTQLAKTLYPSSTHIGLTHDKCLLRYLKPCTHGSDLHIRKFCMYANFAYVSKSIFCFAFTWLFKISRICQKLKFNSIKMIDISTNL